MQSETAEQTSKKEKLALLRKERARISNEIAKLTKHDTPNESKAGYVYYMHTSYNKDIPGYPRLSIAAYVDHSRKELCYGLRVWNKGFNRKVSRHKALGKALSTTQRKIARLTTTDRQAVLDKMEDVLRKAELTAIQNHIKNSPVFTSVQLPAIRAKVTELAVKEVVLNGTH
jgi:hypothetical protein